MKKIAPALVPAFAPAAAIAADLAALAAVVAVAVPAAASAASAAAPAELAGPAASAAASAAAHVAVPPVLAVASAGVAAAENDAESCAAVHELAVPENAACRLCEFASAAAVARAHLRQLLLGSGRTVAAKLDRAGRQLLPRSQRCPEASVLVALSATDLQAGPAAAAALAALAALATAYSTQGPALVAAAIKVGPRDSAELAVPLRVLQRPQLQRCQPWASTHRVGPNSVQQAEEVM